MIMSARAMDEISLIAKRRNRLGKFDSKEEFNRSAPVEPARLLNWMMKNRGISPEDLSRRSGITSEVLSLVLTGDEPISAGIRNQLRGTFGEAANVLYRAQREHDYFAKHNRRPPARTP